MHMVTSSHLFTFPFRFSHKMIRADWRCQCLSTCSICSPLPLPTAGDQPVLCNHMGLSPAEGTKWFWLLEEKLSSGKLHKGRAQHCAGSIPEPSMVLKDGHQVQLHCILCWFPTLSEQTDFQVGSGQGDRGPLPCIQELGHRLPSWPR